MLNVKMFEKINFFLGDMVKVNSLKAGAIENGGATQLNDGIYSNIESNDFIKINEDKNILSVFVPSTLDIDSKINNELYIKKYYDIIENRYNSTISILKTKGSWYSDDMKKVVIEDITILSLNKKEVTVNDINFFLDLGLLIKNEMNQEAVSVTINKSLCLV